MANVNAARMAGLAQQAQMATYQRQQAQMAALSQRQRLQQQQVHGSQPAFQQQALMHQQALQQQQAMMHQQAFQQQAALRQQAIQRQGAESAREGGFGLAREPQHPFSPAAHEPIGSYSGYLNAQRTAAMEQLKRANSTGLANSSPPHPPASQHPLGGSGAIAHASPPHPTSPAPTQHLGGSPGNSSPGSAQHTTLQQQQLALQRKLNTLLLQQQQLPPAQAAALEPQLSKVALHLASVQSQLQGGPPLHKGTHAPLNNGCPGSCSGGSTCSGSNNNPPCSN
jgi:hypothetical protein